MTLNDDEAVSISTVDLDVPLFNGNVRRLAERHTHAARGANQDIYKWNVQEF